MQVVGAHGMSEHKVVQENAAAAIGTMSTIDNRFNEKFKEAGCSKTEFEQPASCRPSL